MASSAIILYKLYNTKEGKTGLKAKGIKEVCWSWDKTTKDSSRGEETKIMRGIKKKQ